MPAVLAATTPTASQTATAFPATINKMANARYRTVPASNQGMGVSNPRLAMGSRVDAPRPINARYRLAMGTIPELRQVDHPWIQEYFSGPRGRAAAPTDEKRT
jgi:hypothetical protein